MEIKMIKECLKREYIDIINLLFLFIIIMILLVLYKNVRNEKVGLDDNIYTINNEWTYLRYQDMKYLLSQEVDRYIHKIAPTSALDGLYLVDKCEEHNVDILFVLAQGQKESHFGTQGLAKRTNSVWNVFAYDGYEFEKISSNGIYLNANLSIEPYLLLLNKDYLNNKCEADLLENFVNYNGQRYATYENYEIELTKLYLQLKNSTTIDSLQQEMKKYKSFLK
jgi:hypothetical protein